MDRARSFRLAPLILCASRFEQLLNMMTHRVSGARVEFGLAVAFDGRLVGAGPWPAVHASARRSGEQLARSIPAARRPLGADPGFGPIGRVAHLSRRSAPTRATLWNEHGSQLVPEPDIVASFNSDVSNWHFGEGAAPASEDRLRHGRPARDRAWTGVCGLRRHHGQSRHGADRRVPYIFDLYTENRQARRLLRFPDNSTRLDVRVASATCSSTAAWCGQPTVTCGSGCTLRRCSSRTVSDSHLDEATYLRGNPNSLMTPRLGMGESIRTPGPITLAIFRTMGW